MWVLADHPGLEKRSRILVVTLLLVATTMAHLNCYRLDGPDRDRRQGGSATTTPGPHDGSGRGDEIALMTVHGATIEYTSRETTSANHVSRIVAVTPLKLRCINKSPGGSRSLDATRRRRRF